MFVNFINVRNKKFNPECLVVMTMLPHMVADILLAKLRSASTCEMFDERTNLSKLSTQNNLSRLPSLRQVWNWCVTLETKVVSKSKYFLSSLAMKRISMLLDTKYSRLCTLYFSMSHILSDTNATIRTSQFELSYVYSCLLTGLNLEEKVRHRLTEKFCYIYKFLHQSWNPELIQKVFLKRANELTIKLSSTKILDSLAPIYVASNSGISEWAISTHEGLNFTAEYISLSVGGNISGRVKVKINNNYRWTICSTTNRFQISCYQIR